jgi:hypothetical protein
MRDQLGAIPDVRTRRPQAIADAADQRKRRRALLGGDHQLFIIAADHPARGTLRLGERAMAMAKMANRSRTLLFPPDRDVTGAVDTTVSLMRG